MLCKKRFLVMLVILSSLFTKLYAVPPGQVLQINTNLRSVSGNPTWVLIIRDTQSGLVTPYIFDIKQKENYWLAFTFGRVYRITSSQLQFRSGKTFHNFCHLENGVLSGKSMFIYLTGDLKGRPDSYRCNVNKYNT